MRQCNKKTIFIELQVRNVLLKVYKMLGTSISLTEFTDNFE